MNEIIGIMMHLILLRNDLRRHTTDDYQQLDPETIVKAPAVALQQIGLVFKIHMIKRFVTVIHEGRQCYKKNDIVCFRCRCEEICFHQQEH